jgi:hypothetical protein
MAEEENASDEIRQAFGLIGKMVAARHLAVPAATHSTVGGLKVGAETVEAAMLEVVQAGYVSGLLIEALEKSECPLVQALRKAICDKWIDLYAADIAEARL